MTGGGTFLSRVFSSDSDSSQSPFPWEGLGLSSLGHIASFESSPSVPIVLLSPSGYDVSERVESLAKTQPNGDAFASIAMGSPEGIRLASSAISAGLKAGSWVLLKNVHLVPAEYLHELARRIREHEKGKKGEKGQKGQKGQMGQMVKKGEKGEKEGENGAEAETQSFRLFLTASTASTASTGVSTPPSLPPSLLRSSSVLISEPPLGIRSSLLRFLSSIPPRRMTGPSSPIKNRLFLLVAWLYAVVTERLRYVPNGWSERIEWSEADGRCALDVVDGLVDKSLEEQEGAQLRLENVPWEGLRTMLTQSLFGAKVSDVFDMNILTSFVDSLFTEASFGIEFEVVEGVVEGGVEGVSEGKGVRLPEGSSRDEILEWVEGLGKGGEEGETVAWLGLDGRAESHRLRDEGRRIIERVRWLGAQGQVGGGGEGGDKEAPPSPRNARSSVSTPTKRRKTRRNKVRETARGLLASMGTLPAEAEAEESEESEIERSSTRGSSSSSSSSSSLSRFMSREVAFGRVVLGVVRGDLAALVGGGGGEDGEQLLALTNRARSVSLAIGRNDVPSEWREILGEKSGGGASKAETAADAGDTVANSGDSTGSDLEEWARDFNRRLLQLGEFCNNGEGGFVSVGGGGEKRKFWLGGLFFPKAFFTATRLFVTEGGEGGQVGNGTELEKLVLKLRVAGGGGGGRGEFGVEGVSLENATIDEVTGVVKGGGGGGLDVCAVCWEVEELGEEEADQNMAMFPIYCKRKREEMVGQILIDLGVGGREEEKILRQRGAALLI